jgi:hypothetical protein
VPAAVSATRGTVRAMGVYEPGWSPEEMRSDIRLLEDATESIIPSLKGNEAALGERCLRGRLTAVCCR